MTDLSNIYHRPGELFWLEYDPFQRAVPCWHHPNDWERLAGMRRLGVVWAKRHAIPTYTAGMTPAQKMLADDLYDGMTQEFIDNHWRVRD